MAEFYKQVCGSAVTLIHEISWLARQLSVLKNDRTAVSEFIIKLWRIWVFVDRIGSLFSDALYNERNEEATNGWKKGMKEEKTSEVKKRLQ
jgi:hypothetical protein